MPGIPRQRLLNQQLSAPQFNTPEALLRGLVAIQAQDYPGAKWSLGLRLPGAREREIEQAIAEAKIIRTWAPRGTLHFVAPTDIRWLLALLAPRIIAGNARRYRELELDEATFGRSKAVIAAALAGGQRLARPELVALLEQAGIATAGQRTPYLLQRAALEGLIGQGVMQGKHPSYFLLDELIPPAPALSREVALAELAHRYFTSRGPATLKDFIWWSGLAAADAKSGLAAVQTRLTRLTLGGREYWLPEPGREEIPGAPWLHLLPGFDEYLLSYQDRSAVMDWQRLRALTPTNGMLPPSLVWEGRVIGTWKRIIKKDKVVVTARPYAPLGAGERQALLAAARQYGEYLGLAAELEEPGKEPAD